MTQDTTKLGVEVSDNGTAKDVEKKVQDLNEVIRKTSQEAREARKQLKALQQGEGGTAGSRKLMKSIDDIAVYSKQRGAAGLTGASARDFAAQAQGLDGLVRLYATYAANVFALGAAFRGLGQAMETKNMVEGLNQLGAAVGRNLGGLSVRVSELTGGAISMREAMQAVALTSSGGMSSKNIERLASVARSASLALGVSMPDAMSRLSRGITKLEPELLDELGIMTRLEPATQAYARELGKTVTQLTDFERRQAFANAVLAEGEAKFGAITNLQTNPYDRLISSLKNLAQEGAEVINKVLAPIAEFLSQSPGILGGGVLALLGKIIKSAIPDIGEFKSKLSESVNAAAELAKVRASEAKEAEVSMTREAKQQAEARAINELNAVTKAEEKIQAIRNKGLRDYAFASKILKKLEKEGIYSITQDDIKALDTTATRRENRGKKEEAAAYRELSKAVKDYAAAEELAANAISKETQALNNQKNVSKFSIAGMTRDLAIAAEQEAIKKSIISNAAYNASLIGISKSAAIMKEEINNSTLALSAWGRSVLVAQGYAAIFTGVLSTLGNAFLKLTNIIAYIGTAVAVFTIIDSVFSKATKELDRFSKALETSKASAEGAARTVAQLERTMTSGTINGIMSMGNSLEDLNNNLTELVESYKEAKKVLKVSIFDSLEDSIKSIFGGGVDKNFANNLLEQVQGALAVLSKSSLKEESQAVFKELLNINTLDVDSLRNAISKLSMEGVERLQEAIANSSRELSNSSSRVQTFKQSIDAATRAYQQFIQSTSNTSPLFRVGAALQNLGVSMFQMSQSVKLGVTEINAAINHISEFPDAGVIFGTEFVEELVDIREEFAHNTKVLAVYQSAIEDLDKQMANSKFNPFKDLNPDVLSKEALAGVERLKELSKAKEQIEQNVTLLSEQQSKKARDLFNSGLETAFSRGAELIRVSLGQAMERGAIAITKATIAGLTGAERAKAENSAAKQELDIQLRAIKTNIDLILSQALLRASIDKATAASNLASARQAGKSGQEIKALEAIEQASDIFYNIIKEGGMPNFSSISRFTAISGFTADEDVINRVRANSIADSQRIAEQNEARVLVEAQQRALGISGAINIRSGQLEDTQKLLTLQQQVIQNDSQRVNIVNNLVGITSKNTAEMQAQSDRAALLLKQQSEILAIETAIANAGGNQAEVKKQEEFKLLALTRHERELDLQHLTSSQRIIQATLSDLTRQLDVVRSINEFNFKTGVAQTDLLNAQNNAYNSLYGASLGFSAIQNEIVGSQKAQLDFVRLTQEASLAFYEKERKAKEDIARLDAVRDASTIAEINTQLEREAKITENVVEAAKVQLEVQQKILEVNKKAAMQQDRYNRIMQNSTKAADSLAKAFGSVGSSLGTIAEAFATMVVNSDKNFNELSRIRKQQQEVGITEAARLELEEQYNIQRRQYTQDQLANYGSIAGAAKNLFDQQSDGYKILMALERAMYIAHVAMSLKQLAVDAMTTKASMALDVAETETSGVLAVVKSMSSVSFPANVLAGVAVAGIIAALIAAVGGSGPKVSGSVPGGSTSEESQAVQGTGKTYINGKLSDRSGGALGSTEKVNDIANSLDLIQNNTAASSSFAVTMISTLQDIERNTKAVAAEAFKSTNIGKLTSGFGTIEKSLPATSSGSLLSGLFPKSSKSVEIIDKGIQVIGKFSEIVSQTAKFLEFETIKTTKTKSGFLGIGGKTKIKVSTQTKELSDQAEETVVDLFSSLAFAAISASKQVLGSANSEIEKILQDFTISFKASGMGLSGEQFAEAILAESSVVMNQIIEKALPQFEEFRKLGEGFTSTLIRMATTVDAVTTQMGMLLNTNIDALVDNTFKVSGAVLDRLDVSLSNYNQVLDGIIETSLNDATRKVGSAIPNIYRDLVNQFYTGYMPSQGLSEIDFQLSTEQTNNLIVAEEQLRQARNQIALDLGLSNSKMIDDLNTLQSAFTQAQIAILNNAQAQKDFETVNKLISGELQVSSNKRINAQMGINAEVETLYNLSLDLAEATEIVNSAFRDQKFVSMMLYNSLVETMGGLEEFTEKTNFFFENFFSAPEQLVAKTNQVNESLKDFAEQGVLTSDQLITLTDGVGNLRLEYRQIVEAQNLLTDSGRKAYNTLLSFAPAITDISDSLEDNIGSIGKTINQLLEEFGLDVETFSSIFSKAILSDDSILEIGMEIADTIRKGYLKAASSSLIDGISNTFVNSIIAPILNSTMVWTTGDYQRATGNFTSFISTLTQNAVGLSNMLSNPVFNEAINQATTVATTAITKLAGTLRNVDNIFSNSKLVGYKEELLDLQQEHSNTVLQDAIDAEQERLDLLQEQADVLQSTVEDLNDFNRRMVEFKNSLLVGPQSPLTPLDQYATAKTQLEDAFAAAALATSEEDRKVAQDKIQDLASAFLDMSRNVFSSGSQYTDDFNFVQSILDSLITDSGINKSIAQQQLDALNIQIQASKDAIQILQDQLDAANSANDNLAEISERILELNNLILLENQKGKDAIANSFTVMDSNFNNLLTIEELKASGMASDETLEQYLTAIDTNGDGQISRLESISSASTNTYYTLQSLIPIFEAVKSGIMSMDSAIALIAEINAANESRGGSGISGSYDYGNGTGISVNPGSPPKETSALGGYIQGNTVYGINGQSMSLSNAVAELTSNVEAVASGSLSARQLYDAILGWGFNSQTVANVLGTTKQEVLNWFKYYDSSIPAFAQGINRVPEDMLAKIHKNERILPAADNERLMQSLSNRNDTNLQLINELKELNKKVTSLQRSVEIGAVLNAEATDKNTEEISKAVQETSSKDSHNNNIQRKVALK